MANGKFVSYLRVSTTKQGDSGLGLEAQRSSVSNYLIGESGTLVQEVIEVESGKKIDRPALVEAIRLSKRHKATLLIAKLDRLSRNVHFISGLMESKVDFVAVDMPKATRFTIHIMAAVAEQEAEAISNRTKAALAAARERGSVLGGLRPESVAGWDAMTAKGLAVRIKLAKANNQRIGAIITVIKAGGITSASGIARELNKRGEETRREKQWSAVQVQRVLAGM